MSEITKHECNGCQAIITVGGTDAFPIVKAVEGGDDDANDWEVGQQFVDLYAGIDELNERLDAGSIVPSGECPLCYSLTYLVNPPSYSSQYLLEKFQAQHVEDVYILLPRERDTIIAALRLWQQMQDKSSRRFFANNFDFLMLDDITTNGGAHDALDENEIDILIEDKINVARPIPTTPVEPSTNNEDERVSHSSKHRVVVSVSGGLVQAVYGDDSAVEVLTVDHDNIEQGDDGVCDEHLIPLDLLKDNETAEAIQKYLEPDSDDLCDTCMRSGVAIARTDEDGNTVCVECDED